MATYDILMILDVYFWYTYDTACLYTQAHEAHLKKTEAEMMVAQEGIITRTMAMMESKAAAFNKAVQVCSG